MPEATLSLTRDLRPSREAENPPGAPLRWPRPRVVNLTRCQGAVVSGVTIENSPSWSLHLVYCDGVWYLFATINYDGDHQATVVLATPGIATLACDDQSVCTAG